MSEIPGTYEVAGQSRPWSLRLRALLAGTVVVGAFMLLLGVALERAYRDSALEASRERRLAHIYMLMGAADIEADGTVRMPAVLPSPELSVPDSGVLAAITDSSGALLWRSESSLVATLLYPSSGQPGEPLYGKARAADGTRIYTTSYPLIWELDNGDDYVLLFHAAEDAARVAGDVAAFRATLQWWLGGAAVLLLVLQAALLVWVLRPLGRVAGEVAEVERGTRERLGGNYPRELQPLTRNLNGLLATSRSRLQRYRDALADLAHSLKTPLAVLRGSRDGLPAEQRAEFDAQLERMDETIGYQLQRAALSGRAPLAGPVDVAATVSSIVNALQKVYHDKRISIDTRVPADVQFSGDAGDLAELLGNLGDNACKWCRQQVRISVSNRTRNDGRRGLAISVEDDGPGIPANLRDTVMERGRRADSTAPGHGVGLAIVRDIVVEAYGGELQLDSSSLGGARVDVLL